MDLHWEKSGTGNREGRRERKKKRDARERREREIEIVSGVRL